MTAMQVTATEGGVTANGILLRVRVLNGTADIQNGATAQQSTGSSGTGPAAATVTTTVTGSMVYGALAIGAETAWTVRSGTTITDNHDDTTHGNRYASCQATAATGTPGATIFGTTAPTATGWYYTALAEILPNGVISEEPSGPALAQTDAAATVTTASFSPSPGALLVAQVCSNGGSGVTTMTVSGGGISWTPLIEANNAGMYAGVWIGVVPYLSGDDPPITSTQGGSTAAGMIARIKVLTGAAPAALQTGATATQSANAAHQASITTTTAGSIVYGGVADGTGTTMTAAASTTLFDNFSDATHGNFYGTCRTTAVTGTPGAVTVGASAPTSVGGAALAEILPATPGGTITEDVTSPPSVSTTAATAVTVNVTPPGGSLLVLMLASNGSAGIETMTVSGGGLNWIPKAQANATGQIYAGVWIADVPLAPGGQPPSLQFAPAWHPGRALPGMPGGPPFWLPPVSGVPAASAVPQVLPVLRGSPVQARQLPQPGGRVTSRSGLFAGTGAPVRAATGPVRARVPQPLRGGQAAARRGPYGGLGPVLKALAAAVAGTLRGLPPRGRTATRAGAAGALGPPVRPASGPVRAQPAPRRGGSTASRAGTFTAAAPQTGPPVYPLHGPVQARRQPQPGGHVSRTTGPYDGTGPQLRPPEGPLRAQPAQRRGGSVQSRAGTFTFVSLTSGPPVYPLHGPVQARRLPQRGGSTSSRTGAYGRTGPQLRPPEGPVRAQPPPQRGGHTAGRAGTFTFVALTSGPPVYPQGHPVQARRLPARGGTASHRAGPYAGSGPAVPALKQPLGLYRQQPPPPARGRVMSLHGAPQPSGPAVPPLHRAIRARLPVPVLTGRARTTLYPAVATPPPPFTIGTLTASGAPGSTLTAAQASSALTATTAGTATLTAADIRTGGPG